jgi:hypothetical protein
MIETDLATWLKDPKSPPPSDCPDQAWAIRGYKKSCHLCSPGLPTESGARTFHREREPWWCPSVESYQRSLKEAQSNRRWATDDLDQSKIEVAIAACLSGLGLIVGIFGTIAFFMRRKRRLERASTSPAVGRGYAVGVPS